MKNKLSEIRAQFQKIIKSETVPEMVTNVPWELAYFLLFIPLFLMMVVPVWQLAENFFDPEGRATNFRGNVSAVFNSGLSFGIIAVLIISAKIFVRKESPRRIFSSYTPLIFFAVTVVLMLASSFVNGFTENAKYGDVYRNESLRTAVTYFVYFFLVPSVLKNRKQKALLLYTLVAANTVLSVFMIIDQYVTPLGVFDTGTKLSSVFYNSNHYGYYMVIAILVSSVLFIKEKRMSLKILCMASFILTDIVLIINDTFGAYIACLAGLVFAVTVLSICEGKFNKPAVFMLGLFILVTLIMSVRNNAVSVNITTLQSDVIKLKNDAEDAGSAGSGRWRLWKETVQYIKEKPLLGFGIEGIGSRLNEAAGNDRPHCEFLQYAAFYGIPAAITYICGAFSVFLNGLKNKTKLDMYNIASLTAAFGYLVSSSVGNTMYYTAPYFFIVLGLGFNLRNCEE